MVRSLYLAESTAHAQTLKISHFPTMRDRRNQVPNRILAVPRWPHLFWAAGSLAVSGHAEWVASSRRGGWGHPCRSSRQATGRAFAEACETVRPSHLPHHRDAALALAPRRKRQHARSIPLRRSSEAPRGSGRARAKACAPSSARRRALRQRRQRGRRATVVAEEAFGARGEREGGSGRQGGVGLLCLCLVCNTRAVLLK